MSYIVDINCQPGFLYSCIGERGPKGERGPPGPSGGIEPSGTIYSQYLYWNTNTNSWQIDGSNVHIGDNAGLTNQGSNTVAIGSSSGQSNQGECSVAVGYQAGQTAQASNAVAIGCQAGQINQRSNAVAIGFNAGQYSQQRETVAIGDIAGRYSQQEYATAVGNNAGNSGQNERATAIGNRAGYCNQGTRAVSLGTQAGESNQGERAISIGAFSGNTGQKFGSVALGYNAGSNFQGTYSIAIGYNAGVNNQSQNSIILNAQSNVLEAGKTGLFIKPIDASNNSSNVLVYNIASGEVNYSTAVGKTFIIPHPINSTKYLVHACLEGPESGVYYRGRGEITNGSNTIIHLSEYVNKIASDFSVQITGIYDGKSVKHFNVSDVENGSFQVYGENGKFHWYVVGRRLTIDVEPERANVVVKGDGPYTYI